MSINRQGVGVGVLDGVIYAIGGYTGSVNLKSVEAYRPSEGVWSFIVDMHMCRRNPGKYNISFNYFFLGLTLKIYWFLITIHFI